MELKIFFDRIEEQLYENIFDGGAIFHNIAIHSNRFPDWQQAKIALIGLQDDRGNKANEGASKGANEVRRSLYRLKKGLEPLNMVDLGNLRNGDTLQDTYLRIKEICEILIENGLFVILIGGTHNLDFGQYLAYEKFEKLITLLTVDAITDLRDEQGKGPAATHLHDIIAHEPNYLFHLCHIASQSFLNDQAALEAIERLHFENIRLGMLRENISEIEPLIRQADLLSFDIGAIKRTDAPGNKAGNIFGLTAEEACQIAWYAGINDKLTSVGIYEYNPFEDKDNQTAFVIATMIWYLIEGFNHRKGDLQFDEARFMRYMVSIGKEAEDVILFYKSKFSDKWWMEISYLGPKKESKRTLIPCSYSDYETALKGEIPQRWLLMQGKL